VAEHIVSGSDNHAQKYMFSTPTDGRSSYASRPLHDGAEEGGDPVSATLLILSVFLACAVEAVEALTIVLAAGTSRDWRSALTGVGAGLLVLAAIVAALGPALTVIPIGALRLVVGGLLLVFGLQWLRKAILRAAGLKALHDETAIYARQTAAARGAVRDGRFAVPDWYAFTLSFKGVLLEGLEVAFIVITFGSAQGRIDLAALGAGIALVLVAVVGVLVRGPLTRVPENSLKFAVGVMLTTFGIFWSAEGAGAHWPGDNASLPGVLAFVVLLSFGAVTVLKRQRLSFA
jgi:uncharacterized membrane protein